MGLRFYKRIGGAAGFNISKSGVSASIRTSMGSIGTRGYSIRTGIPGLYFRGSWRTGSRARRGSTALDRLVIRMLLFPIKAVWVVISYTLGFAIYLVLICGRGCYAGIPMLWSMGGRACRANRPRIANELPPQLTPLATPTNPNPNPRAFEYVARDWEGNRVSGTIDAHDKSRALKHLEKMRLVPISIKPKGVGVPAP